MHVLPNGKAYIGQTTQTLKNRFLNGKGYHSCSLFYKAIKKYGWQNVRHKVLFEVSGDDEYVFAELNKKETELIAKYKTDNVEYGYNLRKGGDNGMHSPQSIELMRLRQIGRKASAETKKKLSEAKKGDKNPNYGRVKELHPMYSKHHTKQARESISKNLTGMNNYQSLIYELYNKNNQLVVVGNSHELKEGGYVGTFRHCASGRTGHKYVRDRAGNKYTVKRQC